MARVLLALVIVVVAFTVYALVDCLMLPKARVKALPRVAWVFIIILFTPIGGILWLVFGRARRTTSPTMRAMGPDDDPDFLGTIRMVPDPTEDERIRELEKRLAETDDETDNGRTDR
ncbi:PLDc N-terminal domain-containing protein [Herbiconiux sp. CPCC 203407]|uniref:PLDc N-terminal domain-containing protein n=1 Tax=Herbiconiux oxytropis TaxID=2970915 RepID=A0AA41XIF9_9MICO|nr:PLDc N-terminal domain-containing protein [Herbiconiux oxytropis]MCS5722794.1 PLDc N-terminal domain-containing protein [Herbiconiux oxytropis]MCS5727064.1 PLDc N-terminal domain-containing protein [Herbiconiux oxytropis]